MTFQITSENNFYRQFNEIELYYELFVPNYNFKDKQRDLKKKEQNSLKEGRISYVRNCKELSVNQNELNNYIEKIKGYQPSKDITLDYIIFCRNNNLEYKEYQNIFKFLDTRWQI